jgi:purine nucleosidase
MGGAFDQPGNATPFAEFNIAVDPEAANQVAESDLNVTWIGLDVTHSADLYRSDWELLEQAAHPAGQLVREVCRHSFDERGKASVHLHDPLAIGVVLDP